MGSERRQTRRPRRVRLTAAERKRLCYHLAKVDRAILRDRLYEAMGEEKHLDVFPERRQFWDSCIESEALEAVVGSYVSRFVDLFREQEKVSRGTDKYTTFQIEWYRFLSTFIVDDLGNAILSSVGRIVYKLMNQHAQQFQEETAKNSCDALAPSLLEESVLEPADDTALLRICGASLLRLKKLKKRAISSGRHTYERVASLKRQLEMIRKIEIVDKSDLPYAYRCLDKGNLCSINLEFLPALHKLDVAFKHAVNPATFELYGKDLYCVSKMQVLADKAVQSSFDNCANKVLSVTTSDQDMLVVYNELVTKLLHTRFNDFLKGQEQLQHCNSTKALNPDVTVMLRDKLKGLVALN